MKFLDNKYTKWYFSIIEKAKLPRNQNQYFEKHHILPRSLGGSNDVSNLVSLTAKEHFIVHALLVRMFPKNSQSYGKMLHAIKMMKFGRSGCKRYINSMLYEHFKKEFSAFFTGHEVSAETKRKIAIANLGKKQSLDTIAKRVEKNTGKKRSVENKQNSRLGALRVCAIPIKCDVCGKEGRGNAMRRWHFSSCKELKRVA